MTILPSCVVSCRLFSLRGSRSHRLAGLVALLALPLLALARTKEEGANGHTDIDRRARPSIRAYHVDTPPTLDGLVNEPIWTAMQPATGFVQQEPNNGEPSTEQTEVRIAFDDDNLYLGVICLDSQPDNIVVTQNRRDASLENTDSVEILFDTFNDKQNGVIFGTESHGRRIRCPGFESRPGPRWRRQSSPGGWRRHNKHQQHTTRRCCRSQHQLGRCLDRAFTDHGARLGSRV